MWETLLNTLRATGVPFAEQAWVKADKAAAEYGILRLRGGGGTVWADGGMAAQAMAAAVHYFSRSSGLIRAGEIQEVLNGIGGLSWSLSDIQYEDDTKLTHYTWLVEWAG